MAVGGGTGPARDEGEWMRAYGRVVTMLPRVEALAAGRARLEAVNELQHEFWEARDALLQRRLLQAEESRRRWEVAYVELQPSSSARDDRKFAELQKSDFEDLTSFIDVLDAENKEFQIKVKEVHAAAEHSQYAADHEHITRDIEAELRKLKHAYEAFCSEKNREVSQLTAERDFARYQFKTLEPDYVDLLSYRNTKAARASEAAQKLQQNVEQLQVAAQKKEYEILKLRAQAKGARELQQNVEQLQVASQKKDDEILRLRAQAKVAQELQQNVEQLQVASQKKEDEILRLRAQAKAAQELQQNVEQLQVASQKKEDEILRLRAQAKAAQELQQNVEQLQVASQKEDEILRLRLQAKAAEAKKKLVEGKLQKVYCMAEEIDGENEKCKDRQPATIRKHEKDMSDTHKQGCSEGPALRTETKRIPSKQMLAYGQPETNQKRKCVTFLSDNDGKNGNGEKMCKQILEPLKKKRATRKRALEQENNKTELVDGRSDNESNRSPHKLTIYNALLYLRSVKDSFTDRPEKHAEFLSVQRKFVSRKIDADAFISAVKVLLDGHPELIRGFKSCFTSTPTQVLGC